MALIETSNAKNNVSYGSLANLCSRKKAYLKEVGALEDMAEQMPEDRFFLWSHGNFLEGNNEVLRKLINANLRLSKKQFERIDCFGLEPRACTEWQAYECHLLNIACTVFNHGYSFNEP